jgi:uncharacterized repeat protein (TIGR03803 family)
MVYDALGWPREGNVKLLICGVFALLCCVFVFGQTKEKVLYSFGSGSSDGSAPNGGLVFDSAGNIYGTTRLGGRSGCSAQCGTVFELSPSSKGGWTETVLYTFCSQTNCTDGGNPTGGLAIDGDGNLYGTAVAGGIYGGICHGGGCGTVFELSPPSSQGGSWIYTVLWSFGSVANDGGGPLGGLTWDTLGNLYGTTGSGGADSGLGTVFELALQPSGFWNETILYTFCPGQVEPCVDGFQPEAGVSFGPSGDIYGTTSFGGVKSGASTWGVLFELLPSGDGSWTESTLYRFQPSGGGHPMSGVNFDRKGNAYLTTNNGAANSPGLCGSVFGFAPNGQHRSYQFTDSGIGCNPSAGLFVDPNGSKLYGTTSDGGSNGGGVVYEISGTEGTAIYNFCSETNCADGMTPSGTLTAHGSTLYSTTVNGGKFGQGVVFALAP